MPCMGGARSRASSVCRRKGAECVQHSAWTLYQSHSVSSSAYRGRLTSRLALPGS